jgi:DNA-binding transcriptional regulator LsrR (DeoR family)
MHKKEKENKEIRRLSLLAEIASMYYEKDMTQSQIAETTFISRSQVSRLLKESKKNGLVSIKINFPGERFFETEEFLKQKFGLKDCRILNNRNYRRPCRIGI